MILIPHFRRMIENWCLIRRLVLCGFLKKKMMMIFTRKKGKVKVIFHLEKINFGTFPSCASKKARVQ